MPHRPIAGLLALCAVLHLVTTGTSAADRIRKNIDRGFPSFGYCPLPNDQLELSFVATTDTVLVSFVLWGEGELAPLRHRLDNVAVVREDLYTSNTAVNTSGCWANDYFDITAVDCGNAGGPDLPFCDDFTLPPQAEWGVLVDRSSDRLADGSDASQPVFWASQLGSPADPAPQPPGSLRVGRDSDGPAAAQLYVDGLEVGSTYVVAGWWYTDDPDDPRSAMSLFIETAGASTEEPEPSVPSAPAAIAGDPIEPDTYQTGSQFDPAIGVAPDGSFLVAWDGPGASDPILGVWGQRFDPRGVALGGNFAVNTYIPFVQFRPEVLVEPDGDYVVVWRGDAGLGDGEAIQLRRFVPDGTPLDASEVQVNSLTTGNQRQPSIARFPDGDFIVVWESRPQPGDFWRVLGRRVAADGTPLGGDFPISPSGDTDRNLLGHSSVAVDGEGRFMVVWQIDAAPPHDAYGRIFEADGTPVAGPFFLDPTFPVDDRWPVVAGSPDGGFLAAWADPSAGELRGRFFGSDGVAGPVFPISVGVTEVAQPSLAAIGDSGFIVAWSEAVPGDGDGSGIRARQLRADGSAWDAPLWVNLETTGDQTLPAVAANGRGDVVVSWSTADEGDAGEIGVQRLEAVGCGAVAQQLPSFVVTKTADTNDGVCNNDCSLREAIGAANLRSGRDTVIVPAGTYTLSRFGSAEDQGNTGDLDVHEGLVILGSGRDLTVVDGGLADRIFDIPASACPLDDRFAGRHSRSVTLCGVTLRDGVAARGGGLADACGTHLLVADSAIESSLATSGCGGGIASEAPLFTPHSRRDRVWIERSQILDNEAATCGGGIEGARVHLLDSTIAGNQAGFGGGGVYWRNDALTVSRSTLSGNVAGEDGGGIAQNDGVAVVTLRIADSTISGNSAGSFGGGVRFFNALELRHSTFAGNTTAGSPLGLEAGEVTARANVVDDGCNVFSTTSEGFNLDRGGSCGFFDGTDQPFTLAALQPLADHGGPTLTHALPLGSPAVDNADTACSGPAPRPREPVDQRGIPRGGDGNTDGESGCDAGAFELEELVFELEVRRINPSGGRVIRQPGEGIACGSDCTESYLPGMPVTLRAIVNPGWSFAAWSGGGCRGGAHRCMVLMDGPQLVKATWVQGTAKIFDSDFEIGSLAEWTSSVP